MTSRKGRKFFCLIFAVLFSESGVRADWLLLLHSEAGGKLGTNFEAKVETEAKFRNDMSEYYDLEVMPWVAYRFTDWFKLGLGWRELYARKSNPADHKWYLEQRPVADFMFTMKPGDWTVEDRLRVEYRNRADADAYFRYRNRLRLRPPWKWTKADIQPWTAWEVYYENNPELNPDDRLNRHRFYVGLGARLTPTVKTGCYYFWENVLSSAGWQYNNQIGLEISWTY